MVSNLYQIFHWVLISSVKGGVLAAIILLVKFLFRNKLGTNWHYGIWALLFIQLVLPWTPSSPVSMYNLISNASVNSVLHPEEAPGQKIVEPRQVPDGKSSASLNNSEWNSPTVSTIPAVSGSDIPNTKAAPDLIWAAAAWLWLAGIAFLAVRTGIAEYLFRKKLKRSKKVAAPHLLALLEDCKRRTGISKNISLLETDALNGPALIGVFRTQMLLPAGLAGSLTSEQLAHIYLHELVHYKRRDIAANWIAALLRILHWFNPIILYGFHRWQDDQELSCDAQAVKYLKPEAVREYGRTLIRVLEFAGPEPSQFISAVGISGNKSLSKRRIMMITLFRKTTLKWSLVGAAAIIAVALVAMTLPQVNGAASKPGTSPAKGQSNSTTPVDKNGKVGEVKETVPQEGQQQPAQDLVVYKNTKYGFNFSLPATWKGYSIVNDKWEGLAIGAESEQVIETGPMISIRHPLWTSEKIRQDVPIMIFTLAQWNSLKEEKFHIGAAPIGPSELSRNNAYVFALPARYNYVFPTGYEEVEQILNNKPLQAQKITVPEQAESVVAALAEYFPMHKGNKWVYQGTGNEYASFSREVLFTEGNLAQVLDINGGAVVSKIFQINNGSVLEIFKREEPAEPVNLLREKANEQRMLLKSPLSIGTKWNDGNTQWEIVDTAATIQTPAGTFKNCIKVKSTSGSESVMYQYYAKGVGMVQQDFVFGEEKISSSLESYHLVK